LFGLLGGKSKQKYFTGGKSKKIFYRKKLEMTYITGGKDLLTLTGESGRGDKVLLLLFIFL